ncbi:MAG TPA: VWA domain-containing protein [Rhodocyclaceae bacterium]|nr:VWA domain-containing protein [Rhodocyclaceae bacterium]
MAARQSSPPRSVLEHVVGFSRALHDADMAVNPASLIDLCKCFDFVDLTQRDDFYAAARATLVSRREDLPRFDVIFARYWESPDRILIRKRLQDDPENEGEDQDEAGTRLMLPSEDGGSQDGESKSLKLSFSPDEILATRDLGTLTDADVERAQRLIRELVAALANKRGRRTAVRRRGRVPDLKRLLRSRSFFMADGICPLPYRHRPIRKTRLVLLCDVSGSMQRYSSFLIEFMFALRRELSDLEVAVFSTRLTLITDELKIKGVAASLKQVAEKVHDWAGGTNIGRSLRDFNEQHAPRLLNGRTAVIFLSDGWDRGNADQMRQEMMKLRQRAQKVLWLNPLLGTPGYQPLTKGMQTALPYLDHFLPAHNLRSLAQLAKTLQAIGA